MLPGVLQRPARQCVYQLQNERGILVHTQVAVSLAVAKVFIPKGFKLIAVGERCATPTASIKERF